MTDLSVRLHEGVFQQNASINEERHRRRLTVTARKNQNFTKSEVVDTYSFTRENLYSAIGNGI